MKYKFFLNFSRTASSKGHCPFGVEWTVDNGRVNCYN